MPRLLLLIIQMPESAPAAAGAAESEGSKPKYETLLEGHREGDVVWIYDENRRRRTL